MDTDRWKSILVPIEVYREIRAIAYSEQRTISGQLRLVFSQWKEYRKADVESFLEYRQSKGGAND